MKKAILIFIVTLLFTGCLEEEWDDCNSTLWLTFEQKGGFDNTIGNDVYAYVYKNDKYHHTVKISYEDIKGGNKYPLKKTFTGQLSIAAWAVPKSAPGGEIPDVKEQKAFSTAVIGHKTRSDSPSYYNPLADLYLGTVDEYVYVLEDSEQVVTMTNTICRVNVFIESGIIDSYISKGAPTVQVGGISRESTLLHKPSGEEILVLADLVKDSGEYTSNYMGVMPSYKVNDSEAGKNIIVNVYCGDQSIFSVDTGQKSVAGEEVIVRVKGHIAEIYVNDWLTKSVNLKL